MNCVRFMSNIRGAPDMRGLILGLLVAFALPVLGEVQTNQLEDPELRERYQKLTRELRCPTCQNENVAESGAPVANDIRRHVHRMLEEGKTDEQIIEFMVERFGEFVRYRPEMSARTYVLWYGPFVAIGVGVLVVIILASRARRRRQGVDDAALSKEEQEKVERWLRE